MEPVLPRPSCLPLGSSSVVTWPGARALGLCMALFCERFCVVREETSVPGSRGVPGELRALSSSFCEHWLRLCYQDPH